MVRHEYTPGETLNTPHPAGHRLVAYQQDGQYWTAVYHKNGFIQPHPGGGWGVPDFSGRFNEKLSHKDIDEIRGMSVVGDIPPILPTQRDMFNTQLDGWEGYRPEPDNDGHRSLVLTPASTVQVRPVRWMWQDRIAVGSLALVAGREGIGKSTVCYELAADLTRGTVTGAFHGTKKPVVVAATEDSREHTIVPRLMAAKADLDRVYFVDVVTSAGFAGQLTLPADLGELQTKILEVDAGMVLLDPLMSRLNAKLDTHKDADVRRALEPLTALADECNIAMIGLIHLNKSTSTDPLTMLMASRAFAAVARSVLFVAVDPDDKETRIVGMAKNNLGRVNLPSIMFTIDGVKVADTDEGPVWTSRIVWQGETDRSIHDILQSSTESSELKTATQDAVGWLEDYLTIHKVVPRRTIIDAGKEADHKESALKRARVTIGAGVNSYGYPRHTYWSAPFMTPDEVEAYIASNPMRNNDL